MRRDYFTLNVTHVDWVRTDDDPKQPSVTIDFRGPEDALRERFEASDGSLLTDDETDVACRLQGPVDDPDTVGVVSVTNRQTGDFVLELDESAHDILTFVRAARQFGDHHDADGLYHVTVSIDGEELTTYEKSTFLVYDEHGNLLREHSLIPGGVEL